MCKEPGWLCFILRCLEGKSLALNFDLELYSSNGPTTYVVIEDISFCQCLFNEFELFR